MALTVLGDIAELSKSQIQCVELDDHQLVLIHQENQFYLLDNLCPHKAAALCDGDLFGTQIQCPWHKARFDIKTGRGLSPLAGKGVKSWPVSVQDNQLMVDLTV